MSKAFRVSSIIILISVLLVTLVACKAEYSLDVTVMSGQGVVTPSSGQYQEGTLITIAAIPSSGWEFDRWEGDFSGDENPTTIRMSRDRTIDACFVETQLPTPTPTRIPIDIIWGTPTPIPTPTTMPTPTPTSTSTPTSTPTFASTPTPTPTSTPTPTHTPTPTPTPTPTHTPTPTPATYTLTTTVAPNTNGSIVLNPAGGIYTSGTIVSLTAVPGPCGWWFESWSGYVSGTNQTTALIMNSNKSVMATFWQQWYCPYCTEHFDALEQLNNHILSAHPGERQITCIVWE